MDYLSCSDGLRIICFSPSMMFRFSWCDNIPCKINKKITKYYSKKLMNSTLIEYCGYTRTKTRQTCNWSWNKTAPWGAWKAIYVYIWWLPLSLNWDGIFICQKFETISWACYTCAVTSSTTDTVAVTDISSYQIISR